MQSEVSQRARIAWTCAAWLFLDLALFLPTYYCAQPRPAFWPWPAVSRAPAASVTKSASLGPLAGTQLAAVLFRENQDVFRISIDLCLLLVLVLWSARWPRASRAVRVCAVSAYLGLCLFLAYHHAVARFLLRVPALGEDVRLVLNLFHLLGRMSLRGALSAAGGVAALIALGLCASRALRNLQLLAAGWSHVQCLRVCLLVLVPCALDLVVWGVRADEPAFQLLGKHVFYNLRSSYYEAQRLAEVRGTPDLSYEPYSQLPLARKPDVYVLMIEAYGEALATSDMADAYRALLERVQARLGAAGYHARTAYSEAPVHGGTSWFSISTLHTGVRIDRPSAYDALQLTGARLPTLTRFFRDHGYTTYALQPGNTQDAGLKGFDVFNHHAMVDAQRLGYHGRSYGWGVIPDQFSLGVFRDRYWSQASSPRYVFYMAVSTHWAWDAVPVYVHDYRSLDSPSAEPAADVAGWPAIAEVARIGSEQRRGYFRSVEYEWRLLMEWLESERTRDAVIFILGDHQPRLDLEPAQRITLHTPVHVLSRDAAFVERFADAGFQPGLYADPQRGTLQRHEGLYSLWVTKLMAAYGAAGAPAVRVRPRGIGLAGLNR